MHAHHLFHNFTKSNGVVVVFSVLLNILGKLQKYYNIVNWQQQNVIGGHYPGLQGKSFYRRSVKKRQRICQILTADKSADRYYTIHKIVSARTCIVLYKSAHTQPCSCTMSATFQLQTQNCAQSTNFNIKMAKLKCCGNNVWL